MFSSDLINHIIGTYGYGAIALIVALESFGIPLPGETVLIASAIYAGTTQHLDIWLVIASAAGGSIAGNEVGFWIGRRWGADLLVRYGPRVGISEARLAAARHLFQRYGGIVVMFGRFVAVLRALVAILAGAHQMNRTQFLLFNLASGILWAGIIGTAAYVFGEEIHAVAGPLAIALIAVAVVFIVLAVVLIRRHEAALLAAVQHNQRQSSAGAAEESRQSAVSRRT